MEPNADSDFAAPGAAPLFLLSFRQRDELAALAANAGWRVVAARRGEGVERRFLASGAAVVLVDARGAIDDGLAAVRALGGAIEANGAALLALVSRNDVGRIGEFYGAGATHFLTSPMRGPELAQALRFAERHVARVSGWPGGVRATAEALGWRYDPALRSLQLTPGLATAIDLNDAPSPRAFVARFAADDRKLARAALRRLSEEAPSTAFAHDLAGIGRVVQHLQFDARTGRLHALVEPLGTVPDASAAVRDSLTGARDATGARRWVERRLTAGAALRVLLIGFDRFETVNTAYGRAAGDAVLRAVSKRVSDAVRESLGRAAMVARIGGSEFLVAAEGAGAEDSAAAAVRIEDALARPFVIGDAIAQLGARVVTVASEAGDDAASLLRRASEQMLGEGEGRNAAPLDALAADLSRALDAEEIGIVFQPQVSVSTGAIMGVEALARWRHPALGEIGPETLFAAAERAGLALRLSDQVQRRALADAAAWPTGLRSLRLSINVTAADVARPNFADILLGAVDASGFPRSRLTVEITESGVMEELGEAARLLSELRTAGCRVAVDDFGTGYSSLAYLKALPLDYLKIDKQLSQDIAGSARDRIVVRGVIDMARSLGLAVVAEGVETQAQLELLAKEGCNYYQGFLCAPPLEVAALAELVGGE